MFFIICTWKRNLPHSYERLLQAQRLPTSMLQFLQIDPENITDDKFERYGSIFLGICKDYAAMVESLRN